MIQNPIIKNSKNLILYLAFWSGISAAYFCLLYFVLGLDYKFAGADSFLFNFILAGFGLSFWYSARYLTLETNRLSTILLSHLTGGILASALWLSIGYYLIFVLLPFNSKQLEFFTGTLIWRFIIGFLFYALITSFYYLIIYYTGFQERALKESEMRALVTEAELKSLKFQINPHFIFNSLNSMSALTSIDPAKAKIMILKLADFLRYTLANNDRQFNKLSEELKNIRLYLEIEKIRFEEKFQYVEDITDECLDLNVPNMILQPLFENAVKHAVYETLSTVTLKLTCRREEKYMRLIISNNYEESSGNKNGTGTGIKNIRDRLRLIYNLENLINISRTDDLFEVNIYLPL